MADRLATELAALVGGDHVATDSAVLAGVVNDWTGRWHGSCRLAVAPGSESEVAAVLRACAARGAHVVVQGGNTGLVGGAVPDEGDVLLRTYRLRELSEPDETAQVVTVGAGVTLAELQTHLHRYGLEFAVDLAARQSATLGGMAATNAGGLHVLHDGDMRRQVLSIDAFDVAGNQVAVLHPLVKDNTGYSLAQLVVGSEGTLAIITRLLLRVVPRRTPAAVLLVGLPDVAALVTVAARLRHDLPGLRALEAVGEPAQHLVAAATGTSPPVPAPWLLLAETLEGAAALEQVATALTAALEGTGFPDAPVAMAQDAAGMRALWRWRDGVTDAVAREAASRGQGVTKLDVTLPSAQLASFAAEVTAMFADSAHRVVLYGHVGDGNLHVNLLGPHDPTVEGAVLQQVAAAGGSISAEHGIGRAKAPWFALARTAAERAAMRAVKDAWDPQDRLGRAIWTV
ncbi:MAG TPA: FAD-binding oxidoreductase [Mycobacteriales bacterium]|nr:FAD-binding oxidoreductase [Mycobacteriales bacterium]